MGCGKTIPLYHFHSSCALRRLFTLKVVREFARFIASNGLFCFYNLHYRKTPTKKAIGTVTATVDGSNRNNSCVTLKMLTPYSITRSLITKREFITRKKVNIKKPIKDTIETSLIILLLRIFI